MTDYSLEVTFDGLAAWVPKIVAEKLDGYFVLWPNAQFAERAYWIKPDNKIQPHVCEPHQAVLLVNHDELVSAQKPPEAVVSNPKHQRPQAFFFLAKRQVWFKDLKEAPLTFVATDSQWRFDTLPHMAEISPRHRRLRADLNPAAGNFDLAQSGLAGFLKITGGNLSVSQVFNDGEELHFARVKSRQGVLRFGKIIKKSPIGNQILWQTPIKHETVTIVLENKGGPMEIVVKADPATHVARIRLVNAELEVPVLGRADPFSLPKGKSRFPDPDFAVYYPLSANTSNKGRRVAVETGTTTGQPREALCAGSVRRFRGGARMNRTIDVELCEKLDEDWLSGFARAGAEILLFVRRGALPQVEELLETLHVDRRSVRTYQGRFSTLIDTALAPGSFCGTGTPNLYPDSEITPEKGKEGILSCFVKDANGDPHGLTVEHLFVERAVDVCSQAGRAGTFARDGELAAKGEAPADCAVFSVNPKAVLNSNLASGYVESTDLPSTEKLGVYRASDGALVATVASVTACVKYSIDAVDEQTAVTSKKPVKATDQILLYDKTGKLAGEGESGSLILMGDVGGSFKKGAPLGLCTAFFTGREWFVASPLAACLDQLKVSYSP